MTVVIKHKQNQFHGGTTNWAPVPTAPVPTEAETPPAAPTAADGAAPMMALATLDVDPASVEAATPPMAAALPTPTPIAMAALYGSLFYFRQVLEHPSPLTVFPSSHYYPESICPFPQSTTQFEHPSPPTVFPSSHASFPLLLIIPSPQY